VTDTAPRYTPEQVRRRRAVALRAAVSLVVVVGLLFVVVFPVQAWLDQRSGIARDEHQLRELRTARERLEGRVHQLADAAEIERLARERYGMVRPGEQPYAVAPGGTTSTTLPTAP
jgi:cell division protein FtsB